jgi:spore cortex biosynthesis protein YabQ
MNLEMQWAAMGLMMGSGLILGVVLDVYRALKIRLHLRGWVVSLVDLLYWTGSALLVFALLMWSNRGELRFYLVVAVLLGFFLYHRWFTRPVLRIIRRIIAGVEWTALQVYRTFKVVVWNPLVFLARATWRLLRWLYRLLLSVVRICLTPLAVPFRPVLKFASRKAEPVVRRIRAAKSRFSTWWRQIRKKGGS